MWIIFRNLSTSYHDRPDRHVYDVVEDSSILDFQKNLGDGTRHPLHQDVFFLQDFFESKTGSRYYARKYEPFMTQYIDRPSRRSPMAPDRGTVSQSPVWELLNPCNNAQ